MSALDPALIAAVAEGRHAQPHSVLGRHEGLLRAVRPLASAVAAVTGDGAEHPLGHVADGLWEGAVPGEGGYRILARYEEGGDWLTDDPYAFSPTLGELDLHLWGEGRHETLWAALGAHHREHEGVVGTAFSVWAPRATAVRVVGDFNSWSGRGHALRRLSDIGVWELFVPGVELGTLYKFELLTDDGWITKADPMARATEVPPSTASKVTASDYRWQDEEWMNRRAETELLGQPMSVYELHFGSWKPGLGYRDAADVLIEYLHRLNYTHVEFLPLAEHPYGPSWGYQVTGYYAPTSRFGSPDDLRYLIDRLHQAGLGVILDWVPGHFPKDAWALARFDGHPLYEHPDPRRGEQPDWGTLVFDFGNPQVRNFLVANALYWLEEFHVDGLRVDAVASMLYLDYSRKEGEWLPNHHGGRENLEAISLLQEVNATAYKRNPGIVMIAEESTSWPGVTAPTEQNGLGFGLKWNMGWMHDSLQYIEHDPLYRAHHHDEITFSLVYAWSEHFLLPISHDEVVHGKGSLYAKMPGDDWQKRANLRAYLAFQWAHPGKKLLFMGQEYGEVQEWSEQRGLDWALAATPEHAELAATVAQLNRVYRETPPLWARDQDSGGFEWLESAAAHENVVAFLRWDNQGNPIAVLVNFSGRPISPYRVGLPFGGVWEELLNTDALEFGGSGVGNLGAVTAVDEAWMGRPASADLTLPPLAAIWLKPRR